MKWWTIPRWNAGSTNITYLINTSVIRNYYHSWMCWHWMDILFCLIDSNSMQYGLLDSKWVHPPLPCMSRVIYLNCCSSRQSSQWRNSLRKCITLYGRMITCHTGSQPTYWVLNWDKCYWMWNCGTIRYSLRNCITISGLRQMSHYSSGGTGIHSTLKVPVILRDP